MLNVASERFVDLLSPEDLKQNEVFEIAVLNHKGRREKEKYFLIHQVNHPQCVDEKASIGVKSALRPVEYTDARKLVLDEGKIDPRLAIFRAMEYTDKPFFRRDLAKRVVDAGMTGVEFHELEGFRDF